MNVNLNFGPYYDRISRWILTQTNAAGYFAILSIILVGILIVLIFVSERFKYSRILFIICSLLTIIVFRGISLYADCFNPDEAHHLANAIALLHDRRLWVATDTTTIGPFFSIFILIVYKIINLFFSVGISFFLLRLIGIIIISISFILLLIIFESRVNRKIAWVISLFYVMFFAFSFANGSGTLQDLQSVNAEYPCMLFITLFLYAIYKFKDKNNIFLLITAGFALGIMPFIKLQTAPICVALALWSFYIALKKEYVLFGTRKVKKHYAFLVYIGTAALPSIILFLYCLTYENGIRNAFLFYILNAATYAASGNTLIVHVKYFIFDLFPSLLLKYAWFKSIAIVMIITFIDSLAIIFVKKFKAKINSDFFFSCILLLFSIEAVGQSMWNATHYIILMVVPALIFLMETVVLWTTATYEWIKPPKLYTPKTKQALRRDNIIAFCLVMLTISLLSSFPKLVSKNTVLSGRWVVGYAYPFVTYTAQYVAEQTTYDDCIVVWGWDWAQAIYTYANRKSGTAQVHFSMLYPPYSSKNIDIYISDIKRNKPKLIIDAIGAADYYDRETYGLENHAKIWPAIRDDYTLIGYIDFGYGIYYLVYSRNLT